MLHMSVVIYCLNHWAETAVKQFFNDETNTANVALFWREIAAQTSFPSVS